MKYYTSRGLSKSLKVNLAKWKRWSREFLPPDPLGGRQSGYARQFSQEEAFAVYLGGFAVSRLHLAIRDAGQLINDLRSWIREKNSASCTANAGEQDQEHVVIFYHHNDEGGLTSILRCMISLRKFDRDGKTICEERFTDEMLRGGDRVHPSRPTAMKQLYLTRLYEKFLRDLAS
ncbi:MAG: hypothetical protein R6U50_15995 [Desulfobacterales bacterium]